MAGATGTLVVELTPSDVAAIARRLRDRRAGLLALRESSRHSPAPVQLDQTSVGRLSRTDAIRGQQLTLETERRRQREISRVDTTRERIARNEFGRCVRCSDAIGVGRLTVDPTLPLCVGSATR